MNDLCGTLCRPAHPFLTWRDFFDDLHLCFDLEAVSASKQLALWFRSRDDAVANEIDTPCIYSHPDSPHSGILDRLIMVPSSGRLKLSLVAHDHRACVDPEFDLDAHLRKGIINHNNPY